MNAVMARAAASDEALADVTSATTGGIAGDRSRLALGLLLCAAFLIRAAVYAATRNAIHPDEVYQLLEPAHRLAYGNGLLPWEYYIGLRSWLYPGALAGFMAIGRLLGDNPFIEMIPVRAFVIGLSLIPVYCAWCWGRRLDGISGGLVVGGIVAMWPDLILIAPHTLSEIAAGNFLMAGLYAAFPLTSVPSGRRLAVAGALFGLTFALRMHLAPALLVASCLACGKDWRRWSPLVAGGGAVLAATGVLDWVTLGTPFQSIWLNFWINVVEHVSEEYGVEPMSVLLSRLELLWGPCLVLIGVQAIVAGRRLPVLVVVPIVIVATHLCIAHKEFRFLFPAFAPIATFCGIATLFEMRALRGLLEGAFRSEHSLMAVTVGLWGCICLLLGQSPFYQVLWTIERDANDAFEFASRVPGLCGLGLVDVLWLQTPGSSSLPPGTRFFQSTRETVSGDSSAFNVVLTTIKPSFPGVDGEPGEAVQAFDPGAGFRFQRCFDGQTNAEGSPRRKLCAWVRDGGCAPQAVSVPPINWPYYFQGHDGHGNRSLIDAYRQGRRLTGADDLDQRL